jgi:GNAT superfamily N-acetyltransferase
MNTFPSATEWRAACRDDPVLEVWSGSWSACFAIESDGAAVTFDFVDGHIQTGDGVPLFTLAAPGAIWDKFLAPVPPGAGTGTTILRLAEEEAARRGCRAATLVTVSFQAPDFYARHGWEEFGRIETAPGVARIFMRKTLAD